MALEIVTTVFAIVLANRARVQAALENIAKRAARKGLPVPSWSWGEVTTAIEMHNVRHEVYTDEIVERKFQVTRIALSLTGAPVRYEGWHFVAALSHLGVDGTLVRALPGEEVPQRYRNSSGACDHCRANRARKETYVLRHDNGEIVEVGSTCIRDFLGGDSADKVASTAEIFATIARICNEGSEGFGGGSGEIGLDIFLSCVSYEIRENGWVSRTMAREQGGASTADRVLVNLEKIREKVTAEDSALAESALSWAESLTDEALSRERSDYLHNVRTVARAGYVDRKAAGIGASIVTAYQRAEGAKRLAAERAARPNANAHLGTIGEKVTFGLPAKVGKKGQPLKGAPTVLSTDPVTLDFVHGFETQYGYTSVLKFRTAEGATVVWFASDSGISRSDVGKKYTLAGTVKKHDTYKDVAQTVLTRCSLTEIQDSTAAAAE